MFVLNKNLFLASTSCDCMSPMSHFLLAFGFGWSTLLRFLSRVIKGNKGY